MSSLTFRWPKPESDPADYFPSYITDPAEMAVWKKNQADFIQEGDGIDRILIDYIQPDSNLSLDDAIHQVAHLYHDRRSPFPVAAFCAPAHLVTQIPYDHPAHKKLAEFMLAFHDSGTWIAGDASEEKRTQEQRHMWYTFVGTLTELDQRTDWYHDDDERDEDLEYFEEPIRYANYCAFIANLVYPAWHQYRFSYPLANLAMSDAMLLDSTDPVEVRNARVIAAAQYIEYQVQTIFDELIKSRQRNATLDAVEAAEAAAEASKGCFSRLFHRKPLRKVSRLSRLEEFFWSDWQDWKLMFQAAAGDETHGKVCRDIAQRAADMMALQEKIDGDRLAGL